MTVVVAGLVVSGCSLLSPPKPMTPHATRPVKPAAAPSDQQPDLLVAGSTVGTGRLDVVEHDPAGDGVRPVTGAVRVVVDQARGLEVRITPDQGSPTGFDGLDLLLTTDRHDGGPQPIQEGPRMSLVSGLNRTEPGGELVLPVSNDFPMSGDPSWMHSLEEEPSGVGVVIAAASIDWTLPSPYPGLHVVDKGSLEYARGKVVSDNGSLAYYVPNAYDTLYAVSKRFGLTQAQILWLNPWMLGNDPAIASDPPELKAGIGVNLDPARR